jgi:hypothetical protein
MDKITDPMGYLHITPLGNLRGIPMTPPPSPPAEPSPEMLEKAERLFTEWRQIPWEREPIQPGQDPREGATGMLAYTPHHKRTLIRLIALALQSSEGALQSRDDAMESLRQDALRRLVVEEKRADVAESARASAEKDAASKQVGLNLYEERVQRLEASVAEIARQREEAKDQAREWLKDANTQARRVRELEAESSSLAQKAQEAERERAVILQAVQDLMADSSYVILHNHGWATLKKWVDGTAIFPPQAPQRDIVARALPSAPATPESVNNRLIDMDRLKEALAREGEMMEPATTEKEKA